MGASFSVGEQELRSGGDEVDSGERGLLEQTALGQFERELGRSGVDFDPSYFFGDAERIGGGIRVPRRTGELRRR